MPTAAFACSTAAAVECRPRVVEVRARYQTARRGSSRVRWAAMCALVALACACASAARRHRAPSVRRRIDLEQRVPPARRSLRRKGASAARQRRARERVADSRPTSLAGQRDPGSAHAPPRPTCGGGGAGGGCERAQAPSSSRSDAHASARYVHGGEAHGSARWQAAPFTGQIVAKAVLLPAVIPEQSLG